MYMPYFQLCAMSKPMKLEYFKCRDHKRSIMNTIDFISIEIITKLRGGANPKPAKIWMQ